MDEKVLVVPENIFLELGGKPGVSREGVTMLSEPKFLNSLFYLERSKAETNPEYKQLIPYCVIKAGWDNRKNFFVYRRTKKSGESRLHDKWSIGVGGHISECDGIPSCSYDAAMKRELQEEVALRGDFHNEVLGLIYDPSNDVGKVHLGVVHRLTMMHNAIMQPVDPALDSGEFVDYDWLVQNSGLFENWSQFVIKELL
jgi:predicted NUDIX family phosphoesterase